MREDRVQHWAAVLLCAVLGGGLFLVALRHLLPCLLPFLAAWLLSRAVLPPARRLGRRLRISERILAPILLLLLLGGLILLIGFSVRRLFLEAGELLEGFLEDGGAAFSGLALLLERVEDCLLRLGLDGGSKGAERMGEMLLAAVESLVTSMSAALPGIAGRMLSALPGVLLVLVITVIAGFYFCVDGDRLQSRLIALLPRGVQASIPRWRAAMRRVSWRYLRAYLILLGITFAVLLLGFSILGVEYAFLLALLAAAVDMLPILGVGAVLLPYGAVMLLERRIGLGVGLLVLYAMLLILRQILEPRLVGKSLGLDPILTLFAGYAGWRLFGVIGMLLGPPVLMLLRTVASAIRREGRGT